MSDGALVLLVVVGFFVLVFGLIWWDTKYGAPPAAHAVALSRLSNFDARLTVCDTADCRAVAIVFEQVNGVEYVWCGPCFQELERDRRKARALITAARDIKPRTEK